LAAGTKVSRESAPDPPSSECVHITLPSELAFEPTITVVHALALTSSVAIATSRSIAMENCVVHTAARRSASAAKNPMAIIACGHPPPEAKWMNWME